ncbi:hypothetical protein ABN063_15365 [Providencia vermicola]|uniref:hypothetical protein n=1 Tax=Providencia vermicola TaxID=333965 RepID=UPI0021FB46AB|nr:hypothetical protein NFC79_04410 [Providencia stuartii]
MVAPLASVTIENFWNEDIKELNLQIDTSDIFLTFKDFFNIKDKQIIKDAYRFVFFYEKNVSWKVTFITESGEIWSSNKFLSCNFSSSDNGEATVGINGDSKRMYVAFPSSSSCSIGLTRIA